MRSYERYEMVQFCSFMRERVVVWLALAGGGVGSVNREVSLL